MRELKNKIAEGTKMDITIGPVRREDLTEGEIYHLDKVGFFANQVNAISMGNMRHGTPHLIASQNSDQAEKGVFNLSMVSEKGTILGEFETNILGLSQLIGGVTDNFQVMLPEPPPPPPPPKEPTRWEKIKKRFFKWSDEFNAMLGF